MNNEQKIEQLTGEDRYQLDALKTKMTVAELNLKLANSELQTLKMAYNNLVLQFTISYGLKNGDRIEENGEIKRITKHNTQSGEQK